MRKLIISLLACALALTSCSKYSPMRLVGEWEAIEIELGSTSSTTTQVITPSDEFSIIFDFDADNTFEHTTITHNGTSSTREKQLGTYEITGSDLTLMYDDGKTTKTRFEISLGELTIYSEDSGITIKLTLRRTY